MRSRPGWRRATHAPSTHEEGVRQELAFHLEGRAEQLVAGGMASSPAAEAARRRFGDQDAVVAACVDQRDTRRNRRLPGHPGRHLRHAVRRLWRAPGYAVTVVLLAGLGLGLASSVFGWYHAYLVRPLPYATADRLMQVDRAPPGMEDVPGAPEIPGGLNGIPWPRQDRFIDAFVAREFDDFALTDGAGTPLRIQGIWVTPGYFTAYAIRPVVGRAFTQQDVDDGAAVAVLGHSLWRQRFGADPAIVGQTITALPTDRPDGPTAFTVVGVLPPDYWSTTGEPDFLLPLTTTRRPTVVLAAPGVTPAHLADHLTAVVRSHLTTDPAWRMHVEPAQDAYVRDVRPALTLLLVTGVIVLLVVGANLTILVLVRALRRQRELAVRRALGAGEGAVAAGWLTEAGVLLLPATVLALALAAVLHQAGTGLVEHQLRAQVPGGMAPLSGAVILATVVAGGLLAGWMGLVPTMADATRRVPAATLLGGAGAPGDGRGHTAARHGLVVLEVALSLVLLLAAGLMVRSALGLAQAPIGFEPKGLLRAYVSLHPSRHPDVARQEEFLRTLVQRVERVPGVSSAALIDAFPFEVQRGSHIEADGVPAARTASLRAMRFVASDQYFVTAGIATLQGSGFTRAGPAQVIVSRGLADRLWPGTDAVGQRLRLGTWRRAPRDDDPWRVVVGVVDDVAKTLTARNWPDVYLPFADAVRPDVYLMVRSDGDLSQLATDLRRVAADLDPLLPLSDIEPMTRVVERAQRRPRFLAYLVVAYALLAAGLALSGLFGTLAFTVAQRRREIAIRLAVGADGGRVVRWLLGRGAPVVLGGLFTGAVMAVALRRIVAAQLHGIRPTDPATLVAVVLALLAGALLALWLPARRAARIDPAEALRAD